MSHETIYLRIWGQKRGGPCGVICEARANNVASATEAMLVADLSPVKR
jgi:hypothetical protein